MNVNSFSSLSPIGHLKGSLSFAFWGKRALVENGALVAFNMVLFLHCRLSFIFLFILFFAFISTCPYERLQHWFSFNIYKSLPSYFNRQAQKTKVTSFPVCFHGEVALLVQNLDKGIVNRTLLSSYSSCSLVSWTQMNNQCHIYVSFHNVLAYATINLLLLSLQTDLMW